jgi:hypothetical protein
MIVAKHLILHEVVPLQLWERVVSRFVWAWGGLLEWACEQGVGGKTLPAYVCSYSSPERPHEDGRTRQNFSPLKSARAA